jgi:hypothetical protein
MWGNLPRIDFGQPAYSGGKLAGRLTTETKKGKKIVLQGLSELLCLRRLETFPQRRSSLATNGRRSGKVAGHVTTLLLG